MKRITLTFDNGPHPEVTPRVLEILARHRIRAWFFVLGKNLESQAGRDLAARELAEGHAVGNHSYSHQIPLGEDTRPDAVAREIAATERLLAPITGDARVFRPFGGGGKIGPHLLSPGALRYLIENRYTMALWNCVPEDWIAPGQWAARAIAECAAKEWSCVVVHDIYEASMRHLDEFIRAAVDAGHEFAREIPPECLPIREGRIEANVAAMVSGPLASS